MDLSHITYQGPAIDDAGILDELPENLAGLLNQLNGFIQYGGGLHLRGACLAPDWHALRAAWKGEIAFHVLYPAVLPQHVPFAEDCVGDQFLLDDKRVLKLHAETGDLEDMGLSLGGFLEAALADPVNFLGMHPLMQHLKTGNLPEGYLLSVYPPFCTKEAANGVSLRPVPAQELHALHAEMAATFAAGDRVRFRVTD